MTHQKALLTFQYLIHFLSILQNLNNIYKTDRKKSRLLLLYLTLIFDCEILILLKA